MKKTERSMLTEAHIVLHKVLEDGRQEKMTIIVPPSLFEGIDDVGGVKVDHDATPATLVLTLRARDFVIATEPVP